MYLKAVTVSHIATSDCKSISYNAWNLIGSNSLRDDLDWPRQPPIFNAKQQLFWRNSLRKTFCNYNGTVNERKPIYRYQVGKWTDRTVINKWTLFYSEHNSQLYIKVGNR